MYELGRHVPLVPVITKADTMTIREANSYRNEVATKLSNPMVRVAGLSTDVGWLSCRWGWCGAASPGCRDHHAI